MTPARETSVLGLHGPGSRSPLQNEPGRARSLPSALRHKLQSLNVASRRSGRKATGGLDRPPTRTRLQLLLFGELEWAAGSPR